RTLRSKGRTRFAPRPVPPGPTPRSSPSPFRRGAGAPHASRYDLPGRAMPYREAPRPNGEYAGPAEYLATQPGPHLTLVFAEVEASVGDLLPLRAKPGRGWWRVDARAKAAHGFA